MRCPQCGGACDRDSVDIGVGVQHGPWRCDDCGWYEGNEVDAAFDSAMERDEDEE